MFPVVFRGFWHAQGDLRSGIQHGWQGERPPGPGHPPAVLIDYLYSRISYRSFSIWNFIPLNSLNSVSCTDQCENQGVTDVMAKQRGTPLQRPLRKSRGCWETTLALSQGLAQHPSSPPAVASLGAQHSGSPWSQRAGVSCWLFPWRHFLPASFALFTWGSEVIINMCFLSQRYHEFESHCCHLIAAWPWANHLVSLSLFLHLETEVPDALQIGESYARQVCEAFGTESGPQ